MILDLHLREWYMFFFFKTKRSLLSSEKGEGLATLMYGSVPEAPGCGGSGLGLRPAAAGGTASMPEAGTCQLRDLGHVALTFLCLGFPRL